MPPRSIERLLASPWLLLGAVLLSFFATLGVVPLFDLDEGAFSEATREMLASGNWLLTFLDGEPRYDKPILIYWLQALSVLLFGHNEFAFRVPSAMAASGWLLALYYFARAQTDRATAMVAGLVLVNALTVSLIAKAAIADALLNLWLALSLFEIYRYSRQPSRALLLRVYLWMGLGMLTKGPVAVVLPLLVSFLYFASRRELKAWFAAGFFIPGWLVFLAVVLPWHVAVTLQEGPGFLVGFYLHHNLGRFSSTFESHGGSLAYYFVVLPLSLMPFAGWLLNTFGAWREAWADPLDRFLWLWFAVVFVIFSFSETQLPHYLLYGSTPLFLLMARHRERLRSPWLAYLPALLILIVFLLLPELVGFAAGKAEHAYDQAMLGRAPHVLGQVYRLITGVALVLAVLVALRLWRAPWQGLVLIGLVHTAAFNLAVLPAVAEVQQGPVKAAAAKARELGGPVVAYRIRMPSFSVYRNAITPHRDPEPGELIFTRIDRLDELRDRFGQVATVFRSGGIVVARRESAREQ